MKYYSNGYLVLDISGTNIFVVEYMKGEIYHGVHEYVAFTLSQFRSDPI